ncbi:MAG: 23S rRNA (pseudouridine(1915)-N(3))-methyltransferase RlmH [Coriobacteriales bacterium]|jgi:23S rRNA (pseudouridine1915-N3)-methyltransferase|nr:23S rRNA (pseudouridine(1915)-N(3))-methyltransferase RlmH [Coriobacteriales bacterium]
MPSTRITITAVGKLREPYWVEACEEYLTRLVRYAEVRIEEISDRGSWDSDDPRQALQREGELIAARLKGGELLVALDRTGRSFTSEEIAALIGDRQIRGQAQIRFLIGGSHGLDSALLKRADARMSFGAITLPHQLARVVALEQIYRAFKILAGEPYHK